MHVSTRNRGKRMEMTPKGRLKAEHSCQIRWDDRVLTGSVFEPQKAGTFCILVTRARPHRRIRAPIHAWWPLLAPTPSLLALPRGEQQASPWETFVAQYWAELDALSPTTRLHAQIKLAQWLKRYPTVTLLSFERGQGQGSHKDMKTRTQRHVLRSWLLADVLRPNHLNI